MFIPISIQVGEKAVYIVPGISRSNFLGIATMKAIIGKVDKIFKKDNEFYVLIKNKDLNYNSPLYRIKNFTFGGVWQHNPDFDLHRIEKEEKCKLDPASFI
jgi:hypothetical protein